MTLALHYFNDLQRGDLYRDGLLLATDDGLETAVVISLFTDRRATAADEPDPTLRRGWWGDTYAAVPGDEIGSRLWLLGRAKADAKTLQLATTYALEALAWMIEDGIASTVEAPTEYIYRDGLKVLLLKTIIVRPEKPAVQWIRAWEITEWSVA